MITQILTRIVEKSKKSVILHGSGLTQSILVLLFFSVDFLTLFSWVKVKKKEIRDETVAKDKQALDQTGIRQVRKRKKDIQVCLHILYQMTEEFRTATEN